MDEKSRKEVLRKLEQRGVTLEDLAQLGDIYMCYAKDSTELEDPVGWYGWEFLEGIVSGERLAALEAGTEPTDREMQLMRDEVVRYKLSSEAEIEDLPSAHLCSLPENLGPRCLLSLLREKVCKISISISLVCSRTRSAQSMPFVRTSFWIATSEQATLAAIERPTR